MIQWYAKSELLILDKYSRFKNPILLIFCSCTGLWCWSRTPIVFSGDSKAPYNWLTQSSLDTQGDYNLTLATTTQTESSLLFTIGKSTKKPGTSPRHSHYFWCMEDYRFIFFLWTVYLQTLDIREWSFGGASVNYGGGGGVVIFLRIAKGGVVLILKTWPQNSQPSPSR